MTSNLRSTIILLACVLLGWYFWPSGGKKWPAGILVPDAPVQENLPALQIARHGEYTITGLAKFSMQGRVLSTKHYWFDHGSTLVPVDLALGWGRMSDSAVLDKLEISQSGRFYFWRNRGNNFPIPINEIFASSANMHLIPCNREIARSIKSVERGHIVKFSGYLARVRAAGFDWPSSMSRTDTGKGACELVYVEKFAIVP